MEIIIDRYGDAQAALFLWQGQHGGNAKGKAWHALCQAVADHVDKKVAAETARCVRIAQTNGCGPLLGCEDAIDVRRRTQEIIVGSILLKDV